MTTIAVHFGDTRKPLYTTTMECIEEVTKLWEEQMKFPVVTLTDTVPTRRVLVRTASIAFVDLSETSPTT